MTPSAAPLRRSLRRLLSKAHVFAAIGVRPARLYKLFAIFEKQKRTRRSRRHAVCIPDPATVGLLDVFFDILLLNDFVLLAKYQKPF